MRVRYKKKIRNTTLATVRDTMASFGGKKCIYEGTAGWLVKQIVGARRECVGGVGFCIICTLIKALGVDFEIN